jgi:hypothetical protein
MRVGLIEFPRRSSLPNIALMRLSAYHQAMGDSVVLNPTAFDPPDVLYVSTLFTWQRKAVEEVAAQFRPYSDVLIGGSGWDLSLRLPPEVDTSPNDYSLFGIDYGIGYSSRGCPRACDFCPVSGMEGRRVYVASTIASLINPQSNRLLLLDNNFFLSNWRPKVAEIRERRLHVSWPQGLDIRVVDDEQAAALADLHRRRQLWNQRFTKRGQLHFAWDSPEVPEADILRGIRLLFDVGFGPNDLIFYTLIGYPGYTVEEELHRITTLHRLGIHPKVMVYRDPGERDTRDRVRMDIQHWNDGHTWRKAVPDFRDYRRSRAS